MSVDINISLAVTTAPAYQIEVAYAVAAPVTLSLSSIPASTIDISFGNIGPAGPAGPSSNKTYNEVPAGLVNGSNKIFTTVTAYTSNSSAVFLNGLRQKINSSYTETGANQITFDDAPITGDQIIIDYKY